MPGKTVKNTMINLPEKWFYANTENKTTKH
jgi:hypothetical protein